MKRYGSRRILLIFILCILLIIIVTPIKYALKSYTVMYAYTKYEEKNSLIKQKNIKFKMPGGLSTSEKDWYPFILTFNDHLGFSRYMGEELSLTILYNFGAFEVGNGASSLYNPASPYYGAFYGGYIVEAEDENHIFGFKNNMPNLDEIASVPKYDLEYLVLNGFGCEDVIIEYNTDNIKKNVDYIGYNNWTKIDATIKTNSPLHKYTTNYKSYIQYGKPPLKYYEGENFPLVELKGRIYVRYFEEYQSTIFLYVIAPQQKIIEECDIELLSKTTIK